jgi:hypothetical protein
MLSESARMTTAEEARYRIDYPNSKPRAPMRKARSQNSRA